MKMTAFLFLIIMPAFSNTLLDVKDVVKKIIPGESKDTIHFKTESGVFYLAKDNKNYPVIKKNLEKSVSSQKAVEIDADPTSLYIIKLR